MICVYYCVSWIVECVVKVKVGEQTMDVEFGSALVVRSPHSCSRRALDTYLLCT